MTVLVERAPPVTTVVLSRPDVRNAVDRTTAEELAAAFRAFEADADAKVGVLFGDHGHFCAGADLKAIAAGNANRLAEDGDGPMGPTRMLLAKPVVAALEGYAVAGGLELALWCDLRVADEDAVLGVFCRRFGVPLIDGGTVRLPRIIGLGRALDLVLTGRAVDAREALAIGLVDRVVPRGQARAAATELARTIAAFPQACMLGDRRAVYDSLGVDVAEGMRREFAHGVATLQRGEFALGPQAFARGAGRHGGSAR